MIIHNLYLGRPSIRPPKTNSILFVYADAVIPLPGPSEHLESISRGDSKVIEVLCGIELIKLSGRDVPEFLWAHFTYRLRVPPIEGILCAGIPKRLNHGDTIARISCYVKLTRNLKRAGLTSTHSQSSGH